MKTLNKKVSNIVKDQAYNLISQMYSNPDTYDITDIVSLMETEYHSLQENLEETYGEQIVPEEVIVTSEWKKVLEWIHKIKKLPHDKQYTMFDNEACDNGINIEKLDDSVFIYLQSKYMASNGETMFDLTEERFIEKYKKAENAINMFKKNLELYKKDRKGNLIKVDIKKIK